MWSAFLGTSAYALAAVDHSVFVVDLNGSVHGLDPRTGASKWKPAKLFFIGGETPFTVVGDTAYGADEDRDFLAVDTSNGAVRWKSRYPDPEAVITSVAGTAGPLVFSTGEVFDQSGGTGRGKVWGVDTSAHRVAWTLDDVGARLAVVASEPAGVVVTADEVAFQLTAYSLKDRSVVWRKSARDTGRTDARAWSTACVTVAGNTFYWAEDQLYALDAATGDVHWAVGASEPNDRFQSVIVLPEQGPGGTGLVVATSTGPNGGALHAFASANGAAVWTAHGGPRFGVKTALAAGTGGSAGVLYAAEPDNGSVFAVDAKTGQTRWTYHDADISADRTWAIAADEQRVYVAYAETALAFKP
ncbi:PQQ-binding-like beta-propeller repeat protein [Catenulispora subtropica]|uniref:Pyrrolo-quinoline quinone repeat domain-containing protein n=1 Tax=Catenulispora subtropica TaxID=450798 RepID=A0ABP5ETE3_9ACTN